MGASGCRARLPLWITGAEAVTAWRGPTKLSAGCLTRPRLNTPPLASNPVKSSNSRSGRSTGHGEQGGPPCASCSLQPSPGKAPGEDEQMFPGPAQPWADTSPSRHARAWESRPQHRVPGHKQGPLTLFHPCQESCSPAPLQRDGGRSTAKAPLPLPAAGTAPAQGASCLVRFSSLQEQGEAGTAAARQGGQIAPLSDQRIALRQRPGEPKSQSHPIAGLGGGLLVLEARPMAPSHVARGSSSLGRSSAFHHLSAPSQAAGARPRLGSEGLAEAGKCSGVGREAPYVFPYGVQKLHHCPRSLDGCFQPWGQQPGLRLSWQTARNGKRGGKAKDC